MLITDLLRAARWIGLRAAWESVRFAWLRDRWESQMTRPDAAARTAPGDLLRVTPRPDGAMFEFDRAGLSLTFLSNWALRATWTPGDPPVPYSLAQAEDPPHYVEVERRDSGWHLSTPDLTARLDHAGRLSLFNARDEPLEELPPPVRIGDEWVQRAELQPEARVFGLGERAAPLNLRPGSYRLWNTDVGGAYGPGDDPLYLSVPLYMCLHASGGYLLYFENSHDGRVELGDVAEVRFLGGRHQYVFIGGEPPSTLQRLSRLIGRPAMPPRWALGFHQSRWGYTDEADVMEVIEGFERHDLPLSALHLDIDYMRGYRVFTVDRERFPDLAGLSEACKRRLGARLVAIIDPGVKIDHEYELYRDGIERSAFCRLPNGRPLRGAVWPGAVRYPDFTDPEARVWWGRHYSGLLDSGVAGIWHDMNEPTSFAAWGDTTFPLPTQHSLEGQTGDHRAAHNVYGHLMNQAGFEAMRRLRPNRRPFVLTRSGYAGCSRYAWNWTGDTASTWEALEQTVPTVLGLGLSGVAFTGPDIGGFSGDPDPELLVRWFQLGALLPFFRTHSSKSSTPREPWQFGEPTLGILRQVLELRQSLIPYLYTLAAQSHHTGWPLARPLFWDHPREKYLWDVQDAYLLGDRLLIAPVLQRGRDTREVRLPPGRWYDFWDNTSYLGPGEVRLSAPLEYIPILIRAGSVIPMVDDQGLALHLYPGPETVPDQPLYSDPGDGYGPSRWDYFTMSPRKNGYDVSWRSEGSYSWPYASLFLRMHGPEPSSLRIDGDPVPLTERQAPVARFQKAEIMVPPGA